MVDELSFARVVNKKRVGITTIRNKSGMVAKLTNYGAKLVELSIPMPSGEKRDVVLGFNTLDEWLEKETYFNAVIGRYANRIKHGKFVLDGTTYQLSVNNGENSLHGGEHGFNEKVWDVVGQSSYSVSFHYRSADGEEGYPGTMDVYVTYSVKNDNTLSIVYEAKTDRPTICGFTQHAYFNLNGEGSGPIRNHILQVFADAYTPFDATACPTGEIVDVEGTPMDFREPVKVGDRIDDVFFAPGRGIDNNFVLRPADEGDNGMRLAAILSVDDCRMEVRTTMPGLQVYTGNWVEKNMGKSGHIYDVQHAICMEAQNFPDSPNHASFPSPILRKGDIYFEKTEYRFIV